MQKWGLESIAEIALNARLGLLSDGENTADGNRLAELSRDFSENGFELEIMPSLWRYISTPLFKRQMGVLNEITE